MPKRTPASVPFLVSRLPLLLTLLLPACDRSEPAPEAKQPNEDNYFQEEPQMVEAIRRNNLRLEPTDFLRSRADDPINWQGWSPEIFEHAKKEQRLIFSVFGSAEFPETVELLDILRRRTSLAEELNGSYVCALADVKAHPELALQLTQLCAEIKRPIAFPVLGWFSHDGCPVAWLPLTNRDIDSFDEVFGTSGVMVSRIWRDSPRYVIVNSARDNEARRERLALEEQEPVDLESLQTSVRGAARSLAALYDPATGEVDGGGGLVPSGLLRFASQSGHAEHIVGGSGQKLQNLSRMVSRKLLTSAVCDPLDGGFFSGRRSRGWEIPHALKSADTQARMAMTLARSSTLLEEPLFLEGAQRCLGFSTNELAGGANSISIYSVVPNKEISDRAFFWSQEKIRELLSEAEFEVAQAVFGLSGLGNIPFESDPRRDYFRKNTLSRSKSFNAVAESIGKSPEEVASLFEAARMRLLSQRHELLERADGVFTEEARLTSANANYAAALAQLSRTAGDPALHQRALDVYASIKSQHRADDGGLLRFVAVEGRRNIAARGEDYAALVSALFSLYRNDLDPAHLEDILTITNEALTELLDEDGYLREAPANSRIAVGPTYSMSMVFGPSTWGSLYGPLERIAALTGDEQVRKTCETIRSQLVARAESQPMVHTDFLTSSLVPLTDTVVYLQGAPGGGGFDALHRLLQQPEHGAVTILHLSDDIPASMKPTSAPGPGATVLRGGKVLGTTGDPDELTRLLTKREE